MSFCIKKTTRTVSQYEINATWLIWVPVTGRFLIKRFHIRLNYLEQKREIYFFAQKIGGFSMHIGRITFCLAMHIYIAEINSLYCLFHVKQTISPISKKTDADITQSLKIFVTKNGYMNEYS